MMNRARVLTNSLLVAYLIVVVLLNLILSGLIDFFPVCDYYVNRKITALQFFLPIIILPITGWITSIILRIDKQYRFLLYLITPIISAVFMWSYLSSQKKSYVHSSICIVNIAKVKDIHRGKNTHYVEITYRKDGKRYQRDGVRFLGKSAVKTLHIGDSLLVLSVKDCDAIMYVYKPHPTLQEFKKCADYGYYFNGNLYSKEEFEGKYIK